MSAEVFTETLELQRTFNASIERVFAAWTSAEILAKWFSPEGFEVIEAHIDCRPTGHYSITIASPDNAHVRHFGEYLEVDTPNKLVFTWILENQQCRGSLKKKATTIVEILFTTRQDQTLLQLKHEKLPDQAAYDGHQFGWEGCLESLQRHLNI